MALSATDPQNSSDSHMAGGVLPLQRAEELLLTLPGVVSAKIVAGDSGAISEVHLLACADVVPKQMVRNVESALLAQLGIKLDHRKVSVATTTDTARATGMAASLGTPSVSQPRLVDQAGLVVGQLTTRRFYFEDIEVRRSRVKGVACRVTLKKDGLSFVGEADGGESDRARVELAAQAGLSAIGSASNDHLGFVLEGCKRIAAFDREFMFVAVQARFGRDLVLLTGSCEVRDSAETATVLAVLDATNRVVGKAR